jgi:hypothetical protein
MVLLILEKTIVGTFPAFGVGWVLSKEDFIANVKGIDLLKLRGGWGRLGNKMFLLIIKRILLV